MPSSEFSLEEDKTFAYRLDFEQTPDKDERNMLLAEFVACGGQQKVIRAIARKAGLSIENDQVVEAVQDGLYRTCKHITHGQFRYLGYPFSAFVKRIAWHCFLRNEADRKRCLPFSEFETEDDEYPEVPVIEMELDRLEAEIAMRLMLNLPEKQLRILVAKLFDNKTSLEIAQEEGMTDAAVRKMLSRLKHKFR